LKVSVIIVFCFFLFVCLFTACKNKQNNEEVSIPRDTFTVLCDPSWESVIKSFIHTYEALNPQRSVQLIVKPESLCIQDLLANTHSVVFVSRSFNPDELAFLQRNQWEIANDTLCYDGLAWIAPKSFPADSLSVQEIKELFLKGRFRGEIYSIELNNAGSSTANYLTSLMGVPASFSHIEKGGCDEDILKHIIENKQSIGCISSSLLVNMKNPSHRSYLSSVKLLKIIKDKDRIAYSPFQNDLALNMYPFRRVLRVLNHDSKSGLGTAFAAFLRHDRGQRAFLKAGFLPYKMPAREIEFKTQ
jgi:phosphate transport system substrate-binding protein